MTLHLLLAAHHHGCHTDFSTGPAYCGIIFQLPTKNRGPALGIIACLLAVYAIKTMLGGGSPPKKKK